MKSRRRVTPLHEALSLASATAGILVEGDAVAHKHAVEREMEQSDGDERTGIAMLRRALETPTRQIAAILLLTEAILTELPESKQAPVPEEAYS
jgi:chaperonin GroEL (HSP60 family)